MATTGLDSYIADTQFSSRNPLFKTSETYHTAQEKRRLKRSKGRPRLFTSRARAFILTLQPIPVFALRANRSGDKVRALSQRVKAIAASQDI